jgi:DNA-binding CsgD family transcriptional regulator
MLRAVCALREARDSLDFLFVNPSVVTGLRQVLPADEICYTGFDLRAGYTGTAPPLAIGPGAGADNVVLWDTLTSCDIEFLRAPPSAGLGTGLVMPLPGPPGTARWLAFLRRYDYPFAEEERDAAMLLQPHIADALRVQSHQAAAHLLTRRQYELLRLVATGYDNQTIARQLCLSPTTVRKHLENAFTRLDVSSRTAAVARLWPYVTWHYPPLSRLG